jgi:hypothetical protein
LKSPVPIAQEHTHAAAALIGDGKIGAAIAIEISDGDRKGSAAHGDSPNGLERPVPIAQQHIHAAASRVFHRQVLPAIAIEISNGSEEWAGADTGGPG